jgi:hypothetical protein
VTDEQITKVIHDLSPHIKVEGFELLVCRLIAASERERCASIAEMPNMTPADIARAIRNG